MLRMTLLLLTTTLATEAARAENPSLPVFDAATFAAPKDNPWFPMKVGDHAVNASEASRDGDGDDDDGDFEEASGEVTRIIVTGPGPVVLGVATTQILDEEWADGHVMERTFDLVATDAVGNVWYFGEDVTNFTYDDAGALTGTSTDASWRAGEDGALPGILVPGVPEIGQTMFIGQAPAAKEMAYWDVISTDATVTGPAGTFSGVLKLRHGSTLEPDDRELKFYAPGVGLVREEDGLSPALDNPEVVGERQP